jgi:hypothetical protein
MIVNDTPTPVLNSTTADGRNEEIRFDIPGWSKLTVFSLWGGEDGEIVAGGNGFNAQGNPSGFIERISGDRAGRAPMPLDAISIAVMTVGPGGMLWAIGIGKDKETDTFHSNILVRLSPDGKLLSSTILDFPRINDSDNVNRSSQMRASSDRVGWLTSRNQYIEFAADGHEITRIDGPPGSSSNDVSNSRLAITQGNTVLVSKPAPEGRNQPQKTNIWTLDRIKDRWFLSEAADGTFPANTSIYGFDGVTLITSGASKAGQLLVRYHLSETK